MIKVFVMWTGLVEVEAASLEEALKIVVVDRDLMDANTRVGSSSNGVAFHPEKDTLDHLKIHYAKEILNK